MIELDCGNVLLKPSHRRHLLSHLRRSIKIGERLGDFGLKISMRRSGRSCQVCARGHDSTGEFDFRCRRQNWRDAVRLMIRQLSTLMQRRRLMAA